MIIKAVITGAMGRMGQELVRYIYENANCTLLGTTERPDHPSISEDIGRLLYGNKIDVTLEDDIRNVILGANVIIDFSSPESTLFNLKVAIDHQIPIVIGTTGFSEEQHKSLMDLAPQTRTVVSPNMSVGVNLLWKFAKEVALTVGEDYDVEIVETHHRNKADAPSGTALRMARAIANAWNRDPDEIIDHGRNGITGEREYGRIGMHAVRGGDVVGEHTLRFLGIGEEITIGHRATSRENFVKGAIRAALFLQNAENGLYDMFDVLKLKTDARRID